MKITPAYCVAAGVLLLAVPTFQANLASAVTSWSGKISQTLHSELAKNPTADIIVSTKVGTAHVLKEFNSATPFTSGEVSRKIRIESLVSTLERNAEESQKGIIEFLSKNLQKNSVTAKSLWISNQIVVKNADKELVTSLARLDDVGQIDLDEIIPLDVPTFQETAAAPLANTWGIEDIGAHEVWEETNGTGIIVATIDSGVRWTHEALKDNYIGQYGWFDPYALTTLPGDEEGHGTHTTGTIAGSLGIGVAPGVKWMSCKGCNGRSCLSSALTECGQFVTCPTLPDGTGKDCNKAPHVVSNSWGGGQGRSFYDEIIAAWHSAGIIPIFANGNAGPDCGSAESPGDSMADVIAVGATTEAKGLAPFSSRGPSAQGYMKPDISAPGVNVRSAGILSDTAYATSQGTSMACPHVAGVVALLISANPGITYQDVKSALLNGASKDLADEGGNCGGVSNRLFPNYGYGHGKVDALNTMFRHTTPPPDTTENAAGNIHQCPAFLAGSLLLVLTAKYSNF